MEQMKMQLPEEEVLVEPLNMRVEVADTLWDYLTTNNKTAKELAAELGTSKSTVGRILNDGGADRRSTNRAPTQQDAVIAKFYEKFGNVYAPPKSWVEYAKGRKFAPIRGETKEEPPAPKQASWFAATIPSAVVSTDMFALYGKWAGKLIYGAPLEALNWYENHILESRGLPEYEQYQKEDRIRLKKIRAEKQRQLAEKEKPVSSNGFVVYTPPEYLTEPAPTPKVKSWAVEAYQQASEQRPALAGVPQVAEQLKSLVKAGVLTLEEAQKALYRQVDQLLKD